MVKPIPKWIMHRYAVLWQELGSRSFSYQDAFSVLEKDSMLSIALSQLRRSGWLEITFNPDDARKRLYTLKDPKQAVEEMIVKV